MCFDPEKVKDLITRAQQAVKDKYEPEFDFVIKELEKELTGVVIGVIDTDALVHSFLTYNH